MLSSRKFVLSIFLCIWMISSKIVGSQMIQESHRPRHNKVVACYVTNWSIYRHDKGEFDLEDLRADNCTHVIYAFAALNGTNYRIKSHDPWADLEPPRGKGGYKKVTNLKYKYKGLKVSLAIGGWKEGSHNYSLMVRDERNRREFIQSVIDFLRLYNFDGLDLDWEYPTQRGGRSSDRNDFVQLLKEMKDVFRKNNLLLTAAVAASKHIIKEAYDVYNMAQHLDYIHIMSYDYNGLWNRRVLPNAPIQSVEDSVREFIQLGAPPRKLVVGLPFYGQAYLLTKAPRSPEDDPLGMDTAITGFEGPYSHQAGFLGYNEICMELLEHKDWHQGWDKITETPYAINGNKVIVYDNPRSLVLKTNLVFKLELAGVMVWSIDTDDFRGECAYLHRKDKYVSSLEGRYPLMQAISRALEKNKISAAVSINPSMLGMAMILVTAILQLSI